MERNRAWTRWAGRVVFGIAAGAGVAGCGPAAGPAGVTPPAASVQSPDEPPTKANPVRFDQSFTEATTSLAPPGASLPPAKTIAGKPTAQLHVAVREAWQTVSLTDAAGKPVPVVVALDTAAGPVEITLFPDLAPNHVRNFLALAKVGYYDGLVFERVVRQEYVSDGGDPGRVELVTAGCPNGDGEPGAGHLGYFLKAEESTLTHAEGTVGFLRDDDPHSAGCRFYVCLSAAPVLDGRFTPIGTVSRGLDVVRGIAARPVKDPASYPESEQPREPVVIRKVERK